MRTSRSIAAHERVLVGDPQLASRLADALAIEVLDDRATHGFHSYPAGLNPDTARDLLAAFPGDSVLDPFCGGGTVLVEARIAGRRTIGLDVSPTALRVAKARTATPDDDTLTLFRSTSRKMAEVAMKATDWPPDPIQHIVRDWYAECAAIELWSLRQGIDAAPEPVREMLRAVFSAIVVKVSWRRSDTSAERVRHHRPPGTTATLFHKKARELARRQLALRELVPPGTPETRIYGQDARVGYKKDPVDLVLTSPPYPGTYDYVPLQHLRRTWLEDGKKGEASELGARRLWREGAKGAKAQWARDTQQWTAAAAEGVRPGGHVVVVIGDGLTPGGPIDASEPTELAGRKAGLKTVARASIERVDHARGTSRWEHVFAFQRPK